MTKDRKMTGNMRFAPGVLIIAFILFGMEALAQCHGEVNSLHSKEELDQYVGGLLKKHDLHVSKIVFAIKIDSVGEIHSCHMIVSDSLPQINSYSICCEIERCVNARFLYEEFKWAFPTEKYVSVYYPFKPDE